jgi:hypothetical protein
MSTHAARAAAPAPSSCIKCTPRARNKSGSSALRRQQSQRATRPSSAAAPAALAALAAAALAALAAPALAPHPASHAAAAFASSQLQTLPCPAPALPAQPPAPCAGARPPPVQHSVCACVCGLRVCVTACCAAHTHTHTWLAIRHAHAGPDAGMPHSPHDDTMHANPPWTWPQRSLPVGPPSCRPWPWRLSAQPGWAAHTSSPHPCWPRPQRRPQHRPPPQRPVVMGVKRRTHTHTHTEQAVGVKPLVRGVLQVPGTADGCSRRLAAVRRRPRC